MHGFGEVLEGAGEGEVAGLVEGIGAVVEGVCDDVVLGEHGLVVLKLRLSECAVLNRVMYNV